MIDRVRAAIKPENVSRRFRELLQKDLENPRFVRKLKRSFDAAVRGRVRHWRELYPEE